MKKIHLLTRKEEINEQKMAEGEKVAVVLDVLLATTTIVSALQDGATEVIPVLNCEEALTYEKQYGINTYILAGELDAKPVAGFVYPSPAVLGEKVNGKALVLSTTNGTVALRKSIGAKEIYIASLLNNPFIAKEITNDWHEETVMVICSGNSGEMSLEDFYGAGHFIDCLVSEQEEEVEMTDAALAALSFYKGNREGALEILKSSLVGRMFDRHQFDSELRFAAQKGVINLAPKLENGRIVIQASIKQ
ncbi:2-phosphosulfolactate phosphatase [Peribacillus cavernae]|uniref:Probable 2-phosphosulfolactate phosphatase n=1 Tax=Peribacillus cavernae TaxID=1674310 RepID=A0A433HPL9_9BACI|nr:2-phosphosulfolactate phosphatase [Peribacillus cavernae]MDQ0217305.1 2-phosphosulfolactate phosphatase [Peribacillus cavernae]RUQ30233.1 2-phosphosulfolactate phosphatase [Peribacillus cavernae]